LVAEVVPAAELEKRALGLAQELGALPRPVAAIVKTAVWEGLELPMERALELERRLATRLQAARGAPVAGKGRSLPRARGGK